MHGNEEILMEKYGLKWKPGTTSLEIEMYMIRKGGRFDHKGAQVGEGLFHHYRALQSLLWPEEDHHRWSDLQLTEYIQNTITVCSGPRDSGKTRSAAKFVLADYYVFPNETLVIVSSTDLRSLELRVWGDIKSLHRIAKERHPELPGAIVDSKHAITTDDLSDDDTEVRDMRRGLLGIPTRKSSGEKADVSNYVGIKQKRRRWVGDEFQHMESGMLAAIANANSGDFKLIALGNPIGIGDPLDQLSEPKCGWENVEKEYGDITKTLVWSNKMGASTRTINLIGLDSPNFDYPDTEPIRYKYLINRDSIERTVAMYGKDSHEYWSQCVGLRRPGAVARRVLSLQLCEDHNAFDNAIWKGAKPTTKIGALDAAYGGVGGDRCVGGYVEFGESVDGHTIIQVHPPVLVPVSVKRPATPEDQIAEWAAEYYQRNGVEPQNFFYDATGRGSLGPAFARIWSNQIQPVEFGGNATIRPISKDLTIVDPKTGKIRPKRCDEEYMYFVTELWFAVRWIIESGQMRELPRDIAKEGTFREWEPVAGHKIRVESKVDMKKRTGYSPDLFDWLATACEGARRRGFQISKLSNPQTDSRSTTPNWMRDWSKKAAISKKFGELKDC